MTLPSETVEIISSFGLMRFAISEPSFFVMSFSAPLAIFDFLLIREDHLISFFGNSSFDSADKRWSRVKRFLNAIEQPSCASNQWFSDLRNAVEAFYYAFRIIG